MNENDAIDHDPLADRSNHDACRHSNKEQTDSIVASSGSARILGPVAPVAVRFKLGAVGSCGCACDSPSSGACCSRDGDVPPVPRRTDCSFPTILRSNFVAMAIPVMCRESWIVHVWSRPCNKAEVSTCSSEEALAEAAGHKSGQPSVAGPVAADSENGFLRIERLRIGTQYSTVFSLESYFLKADELLYIHRPH